MELTTIFALGVGLTCSIHLLSQLGNMLGNSRYSKGNQQAKREDWYCFFKPSDLLGSNWGTQSESNSSPRQNATPEELDQKRRQQANRPRLHV